METITARTILTKASGFLGAFTHTLNPYQGCVYGCSYCYVAGSPLASKERRAWGSYVKAKVDAPELLRAELAKHPPGSLRIFMSSATDPYQSPERRLQLTRRILEVFTERPPALLLVQTRAPLVERDFDLLAKLGQAVVLSMTIETDREDMRRLFTPRTAPYNERLDVLRRAREIGLRTQVAASPLLPHNPADFAAMLDGACDYVVLDTFVTGDGAAGRRTARTTTPGLFSANALGDWRTSDPEPLRRELLERFPPEHILWSQAGFSYFTTTQQL